MSKGRGRRDPVTQVKITRASGKTTTKHITRGQDCFPADALVDTPRGKKRIADIRPNDEVLSFDMHSQTPRVQTVTTTLHYSRGRLLRLVCDGGQDFSLTAHHTVLTTRGWAEAGKLVEGDILVINSSGALEQRQIYLVESFEAEVPTYNLVTTGDHNYIVAGLIAHNFTVARTSRTLMHRWFVDTYYRWRYQGLLAGAKNVAFQDALRPVGA